MSETRSSNFECLRILAIILILIMHSYAQANCKENLFNLFVGYVISAIGNIGVSCFVLLSGYFGVKFKMQRFIQLILITTFCTVISFIANHGWLFNISFFGSRRFTAFNFGNLYTPSFCMLGLYLLLS